MAEMGLKGKAPARRRRRTDIRLDFPRSRYAVERLEVTRPDRVSVAADRCVRLREEFVYRTVFMDMFTRRVRGWEQGLGPVPSRRAMKRGPRRSSMLLLSRPSFAPRTAIRYITAGGSMTSGWLPGTGSSSGRALNP